MFNQEKTNRHIDISIDNSSIDNNNNYNIDMDEWIKNFSPKTKKEFLAIKIAKELGDIKNLALYLSYCKKYPENLIIRAFQKVNEIPISKIKKSRGALFNYLIQKYAREKTN